MWLLVMFTALLAAVLAAGAAVGARGQSAPSPVAVPAAMANPAPAANPELSLPEYISALDRCSQTLAHSGTDSAELRNLRATLPPVWRVRAAGVSYSVDTAWLGDALAAIAINPSAQQERLTAAKQRIAALRESAKALEAASPADQAQQSDSQRARAKLDGILRAKEFQGQTGPSWMDMLKSRFYDWIGRQFDKLHLPHSAAIGNTIAWIVIALAVVLVALWAVRNFVRGRSPEMELRNASAPGRDWRYWLREARAAAERRDYRAAIHAAYWAGVARLEESSLLPEDRSRTPRESLRLVRRESSEYAPLAALTRSFELVWYGYRAATETDWNDAMQQLERLENARVPRPA